jgi:hypothetical protein
MWNAFPWDPDQSNGYGPLNFTPPVTESVPASVHDGSSDLTLPCIHSFRRVDFPERVGQSPQSEQGSQAQNEHHGILLWPQTHDFFKENLSSNEASRRCTNELRNLRNYENSLVIMFSKGTVDSSASTVTSIMFPNCPVATANGNREWRANSKLRRQQSCQPNVKYHHNWQSIANGRSIVVLTNVVVSLGILDGNVGFLSNDMLCHSWAVRASLEV